MSYLCDLITILNLKTAVDRRWDEVDNTTQICGKSRHPTRRYRSY